MQQDIRFPDKKEYSVSVENLQFRLLITTFERFAARDTFSNSMHTHSHIELFCCTSGEIRINSPCGIVVLKENDAAIVPAEYPHNRIISDNDENNDWHCINFSCTKKQIKDAYDLYTELERIVESRKIVHLRDKPRLCREIADVLSDLPDESSVIPALRIVSILSQISQEVSDSICINGAKQSENNGNDTDLILLYKLNHIINSCFMKDISNTEISDTLYISERQLSRIAVKHYGMSVRRVIIDRRLAAAEKLLLESAMNIDSIGTAVGFNSKNSFYRDFKKKYLLTPAEYRRKYMK